jgi:hypothetical protein
VSEIRSVIGRLLEIVLPYNLYCCNGLCVFFSSNLLNLVLVDSFHDQIIKQSDSYQPAFLQ